MKVRMYFKQFSSMLCTIDYTTFAVSGKVWALVNWFNHTSWVTAVTPTDRPKSVRNSYVIKFLVAFLCCHVALWIVLWV